MTALIPASASFLGTSVCVIGRQFVRFNVEKYAEMISLNHRRNVGLRHIFTPFESHSVSVSRCSVKTCDKYKSRQIVEITPLFIPIRGEHGPVRVLRLLRG